MIDVVIPVYRGEEATRRCLESVLAARVDTPHEVIVVDDASPEPAISAWVRDLANAGRVRLVVHDTNRGFVASVNEGMALHPDRDVVLLNSDTEVADGWLDRLAAHAAKNPRVATVTPFSNNATICSYPLPHVDNRLISWATPADIDSAFALANAGRSVEIPTAVGFCMLITRRSLDQIGAFDEARYGAGYGEEVDFCMRATRAGLVHLLAGDVFVRHVGEVSFGGSGVERRRQAQALIDSLYPEFHVLVGQWVQRDAAVELRRRADVERLRRSPLPRILLVNHAFGGGIARHVQDLADLLGDEAETLLLQPYLKSFVMLRWLRPHEEMTFWFHAENDWDALVEMLRAIGVERVHFHHVHGLPRAVLDLPHRLECAYDVTLHDYFPACAAYHFTDGEGRYCGAEPQCRRCNDARPSQWGLAVEAWRSLFGDMLAGASRVIAPSRDAGLRLRSFFPAVAVEVWPHPVTHAEPAPAPVRVLVPGAISPAKGIDLLEACVRDAEARRLPLHFRVIGYLSRPIPQWPRLPLTLTGEYPEGRLAELFAIERGDVCFFPSQTPETFSFTLSAALDTPLAIVATDLGALAERLAGRPNARLIAWNAGASEFNDALLAAAPSQSIAAPASRVDLDAYRARYLEPLREAGRRANAGVPSLDVRHMSPAQEAMELSPLAWLFEDAFDCGRAKSREELRVRTAVADDLLGKAGAALDDAHAKIAQRDAELEAQREENERLARRAGAAEHQLAEIAESRSWRITAPLRALKRSLRGSK